MSELKAGDDVIVDFKGVEHAAEVIELAKHCDYVLIRMNIDPVMDYGKVTSALSPQTTVWSLRKNLRPA